MEIDQKYLYSVILAREFGKDYNNLKENMYCKELGDFHYNRLIESGIDLIEMMNAKTIYFINF